MSLFKKNYVVEVSSPSSGEIFDILENVYIAFSKELNAGVGECVITLPKQFDYSNSDIVEGNNVEIRLSDKDTVDTTKQSGDTSTRIIYRGYISQIERMIDEKGNENITVRILGHYTKLALDVVKSSTQTTLFSTASGLTTTSGDLDAGDIGMLMRAIIDLYRTNNPTDTMIDYYDEDIPDLSVDVSFKFSQKTYREAMDLLKEMAPSGVYWYADEYGRIKFKAKSTTPDHNFIFGRHFSEIKTEKSIENIRNVLLLWNGEPDAPIYKAYEDANSIAQYGRRTQTVNNYGLSDTGAADAYGAKFLAENKDPNIKIRVKIFDNNLNDNLGYDIENINPGDTCCFLNFNLGFSQDIFDDNMVITRVDYNPDYAIIEVEKVKSGLVDIQNNQNTKIKEINTGLTDMPETYTT